MNRRILCFGQFRLALLSNVLLAILWGIPTSASSTLFDGNEGSTDGEREENNIFSGDGTLAEAERLTEKQTELSRLRQKFSRLESDANSLRKSGESKVNVPDRRSGLTGQYVHRGDVRNQGRADLESARNLEGQVDDLRRRIFELQREIAEEVSKFIGNNKVRKWEDDQGREIAGVLTQIRGNEIGLVRTDGESFFFPISRLSEKDKAYVELRSMGHGNREERYRQPATESDTEVAFMQTQSDHQFNSEIDHEFPVAEDVDARGMLLTDAAQQVAAKIATIVGEGTITSLAVAKVSVNGEMSSELADGLKIETIAPLLSELTIPVFDRTSAHFRVQESAVQIVANDGSAIQNQVSSHYLVIQAFFDKAFRESLLSYCIVDTKTSELVFFHSEKILRPEIFVQAEDLKARDLGSSPLPMLDEDNTVKIANFIRLIKRNVESTILRKDLPSSQSISFTNNVTYHLLLSKIFQSASDQGLILYDRDTFSYLLEEQSTDVESLMMSFPSSKTVTICKLNQSRSSDVIVAQLESKSIDTGALLALSRVAFSTSRGDSTIISQHSSFSQAFSSAEEKLRPRLDESLVFEVTLDFRHLDYGAKRQDKYLADIHHFRSTGASSGLVRPLDRKGRGVINWSFGTVRFALSEFSNNEEIENLFKKTTEALILYNPGEIEYIKAQLVTLAIFGVRFNSEARGSVLFPGLIADLSDTLRGQFTFDPGGNPNSGAWIHLLEGEFKAAWLRNLRSSADNSSIYSGTFQVENSHYGIKEEIGYEVDFRFDGTKLIWVSLALDLSSLRDHIYKIL